ncbi:putative transmembrane protein [Oxalobacteraceae bacterium IMCC9480]|jgi:TM2 domain-containing membrane protein YozV|nr:putative transmembrane protein [Oxalobacteraceae bacterium IMCC9480]NDP58525.1 NINE protein [Oxalobacteraceae bacterium]
MPSRHKNKTFATLLATVTGGIGLHRFYLHGAADKWGWLHLASVPVTLLVVWLGIGKHGLFQAAALVLSVLLGFLEALVLGLTPDDQWDQKFNPQSGKQTASRWWLALLLVITLAIGATALVATLARGFDLLFTGGAFG